MNSFTIYARHDGHSDQGEGYYTRNNGLVKQIFWGVIITIISVLAVIRLLNRFLSQRRSRDNFRHEKLQSVPEADFWHNCRAIFRQITYPRVGIPARYAHHLSLPSRGECIVLVAYIGFLMTLMWTNVIFKSNSPLYSIKLEVVAFRAGWVSTVQLPLLYATALKVNPITILTGISYERINWIHRWIARIMIVTLFLHAFFFTYEWALSNVIIKEIQRSPMILWGLAAWSAMVLMVSGGWRYLRFRFYQPWWVSHVLSSYAVLALIYTHTRCTTPFVATSLALLLFDALGRTYLWSRNNLWPLISLRWRSKLGHIAQVQKLNEEYVRLEIRETSLRWEPGQHVMLQVPSISLLQSHPFTISSVRDEGRTAIFIIKRYTGFTDLLWHHASDGSMDSLKVLVSGPFGNPPRLSSENTVIFISTGNRASYNYALLLHLLSSPGTVQTVHFHHIVRDRAALSWYGDQVSQAAQLAAGTQVDLTFSFHLTSVEDSNIHAIASNDVNATLFDVGDSSSFESSRPGSFELATVDRSSSSARGERPTTDNSAAHQLHIPMAPSPTEDIDPPDTEIDSTALLPTEGPSDILNSDPQLTDEFEQHVTITQGRPSTDMLLRPTISAASGDVAVVAAVPQTLGAEISRAVVQMSRELGLATGKSASVRGLRFWLESYG